ncbi:MAG: DUF362 domain-containing protein [Candidatus Bathyarchaeia archaeon]
MKGQKHPTREQIHEMVFEALDLIGGVRPAVGGGDTVLIKPNAGSETSRERCAVTDPYVVEAVANKVLDAGAGEVIIGEAAQVGADTRKVFDLNGYPEITRRTGSRLLDLNRDETVEVEVNGRVLRSVRVFKTALDCDAIINVPVVKTHILTRMTLGLKNLKGLIPPEEKRRFHMVGLDRAIADLQLAIQPKITVVDGIRALGGLGAPVHLGEAVELDLIVAGHNPVAVDAVTCSAVGFNPHDVKHLVYAMEHGIGPVDSRDIEVVGETVETVRFHLEKPSFEFRELDEYDNIGVVERGACSSCIGALYTALKVCHGAGELQKLPKISCFLGPGADPRRHGGIRIIVGRCLWRFRHVGNYVPGCPPLVMQIRDELRELIGLTRIGGRKEEFLKAENHDVDVP